ncbi:Gfo/Idh/MocA family oxidoreductase [Streptomyces sp. FXJ1.4098]|nr:Gfo/Idh/MocA family oxidoreductase [Streptomyces sp. FXJ1.4098]
MERIVVTSPDHTHADIVVRALEAGTDVVVEKPLAIDADGAGPSRAPSSVRAAG